MFYHQELLAKKGPLGRIWIAAHCDGKVNKQIVREIDIPDSVAQIVSPVAPFALRMSGHLLLGVVRIYSRKAKYLLADCSDALAKIKMAFRPGVIDLPPTENVVSFASITLPESADLMELEFEFLPITIQPELSIGGMSPFSISPAALMQRRENIDLDETRQSMASNALSSMPAIMNDMDVLGDESWLDNPSMEMARAETMLDQSRISVNQDILPIAVNDSTCDMDAPLSPVPRFEAPLDIQPIQGVIDTPARPNGLPEVEESPSNVVELPAVEPDVSLNTTAIIRAKRTKKRKVHDQVIELSGSEIRNQLANTSDIVRSVSSIINPTQESSVSDLSSITLELFFAQPSMTGLCRDLLQTITPTIPSLKPKKQRPLASSVAPADGGASVEHQGAASEAQASLEEDVEVARDRHQEQDIDASLDLRPADESLGIYDDSITKNVESPVRPSVGVMDETDAQDESMRILDDDQIAIPSPPAMDDVVVESERRESVLNDEDEEIAQQAARGSLGAQVQDSIADLGKAVEEEADGEEEAEEVTLAHDGWSRTTLKFLQHLQHRLGDEQELPFHTLVSGARQRKHVARSFFEVLQLKTRGYIDVAQDSPYGPITIHKTDRFSEPVPLSQS
eukprot:TRINITY_DN2807_c0_g1_i1.p1 TRINITY_DN2807_c0_g1~~TRINITY_DN2807_c0_g1_i1.p1  ORF type:complete len:624 (+),score=170.71 TRINITY_DN2807_c0_g1_i1:55-1926(+)